MNRTYTDRMNDETTEDLIDAYRTHPTPELADVIESRGVTLWHYGLTR